MATSQKENDTEQQLEEQSDSQSVKVDSTRAKESPSFDVEQSEPEQEATTHRSTTAIELNASMTTEKLVRP